MTTVIAENATPPVIGPPGSSTNLATHTAATLGIHPDGVSAMSNVSEVLWTCIRDKNRIEVSATTSGEHIATIHLNRKIDEEDKDRVALLFQDAPAILRQLRRASKAIRELRGTTLSGPKTNYDALQSDIKELVERLKFALD